MGKRFPIINVLLETNRTTNKIVLINVTGCR